MMTLRCWQQSGVICGHVIVRTTAFCRRTRERRRWIPSRNSRREATHWRWSSVISVCRPMLGVDVLAKSREIYPIARRVLLTAYSDIDAAVRAINEAHLDHYLEKPWDPPEERLFPPIDDLLSSWQAEYRPEVTGIRLIGYPWSPRSHELKDFLASNLIPYRWFDIERDPDTPGLLEAA